MSPSFRMLAAVLVATVLAACPKSSEPQEKVEPGHPAGGSGPGAQEPAHAQPKRLAWREGLVPTAAEAELALTMGRAMFEQAKFTEAEEQLKIASAGGKSEADALLLRARTEMAAKDHLTAARKAFDANDLATAELELSAIPGESVLRAMADALSEKIESTRERKSLEFEAKARKALQAEMKDEDGEDGEEAADEPPAPDDEEAE